MEKATILRKKTPLRVMILTGRFGMGHCAAAEALRQEILAREPQADVQVVDVIDYLFPMSSRRIYEGFTFLVKRCSWVYNLLNRAAGARVKAPLQRPILKKMDRLLDGVDLVIATMPVCSQYVAAYRRLRKNSIPLYTYVTDVTVHDEWIAPGTDLYFAADERSRQQLIAKGVEPARVVISGIPVRQDFHRGQPVARDGKHVLIMGGGLGLIPEADALLEALSRREDLHVTVIAGHNERLLRRVRQMYPGVEAVGFTDKVADYMRRADLIVTKSGGITTFEAIYAQTPLYILRPFLMQEVGNAHFIEQQGIGWVGWQKNDGATVNDVTAMLASPQLLEQMRRNMRAMRSRWADLSPLTYLWERRRCG